MASMDRSWLRTIYPYSLDLILELTLTTPLAPAAKPKASHAITAAMAMRSPLSLEDTGDCKPGGCSSTGAVKQGPVQGTLHNVDGLAAQSVHRWRFLARIG
jgi:hypothetical protein